MRKPVSFFRKYSGLSAGLICLLGLGIAATPSKSESAGATAAPAPVHATLVHSLRALPVAVQDPGQAAPAAPPAAPKPVELPDGDGKAIATEFCQDCHRLTNLTKAHKDLDDWKDTIHTMIDRGARIPDEKIDTLAQYLTVNFGPKDAAAAANGPAASPAAPAQAPATAPAAPAKPAEVVLPDGDGKAIATENCQACHKLTNLTKAHKSLDDWKDTVQLMIDRGANVPQDKVDTLVQYLAKNFGPKDPAAPASGAPAQ